MLVACKSRETILNKVIYQKKQLQNPANPGFLTSPPQAPKFFGANFPPMGKCLGGKFFTSPPWENVWGEVEKNFPPTPWGGITIPVLSHVTSNDSYGALGTKSGFCSVQVPQKLWGMFGLASDHPNSFSMTRSWLTNFRPCNPLRHFF